MLRDPGVQLSLHLYPWPQDGGVCRLILKDPWFPSHGSAIPAPPVGRFPCGIRWREIRLGEWGRAAGLLPAGKETASKRSWIT